MIILFVKTGCPYCEKVLAALDAYQVPFEERNIADEVVANELMEKGGKRQVPFMIDGDISMYESDDISSYLEKTYCTKGTGSGLRIQVSDNRCDSGNGSGTGGCSF